MGEDKAYLYRFLSLAFSYPDERVWMRLGDGVADLEHAARNLDLGYNLDSFTAILKDGQRRILDLQGEYNRLFATSLHAPSWETAYELDKTSRRVAELADIEGFYRAFGLQLCAPLEPDSLVAELEFMAVLLQKQAYLSQTNDEQGVATCRDAYGKFFSDHLGRWIDAFLARLMEATEEDYYRRLGSLLECFISLERQTAENGQAVRSSRTTETPASDL